MHKSGVELKMPRKSDERACAYNFFFHLKRVSKKGEKERERERKFHRRVTRPLERVYTRYIERSIAVIKKM